MRSIGCSSRHLLLKLLLIYGSAFVSSSSFFSSSSSSYSLLFCFSLRLPPSVHINLSRGNLSPLPPFGVRSIGCYSQHLLHQPLPSYGFVFVSLSYSSSSPSSFLFYFPRWIPPRVHIKLPWRHLSMAGGLAKGN